MRLFKIILIVSATLSLGACATYVDGQTQKVTLHTPGASMAKCTFDNGLKYPVRTGDNVNIMRSKNDLVVDCYALGNRRKTIIVKSLINEWTSANIINGAVPGIAYDGLSKGLWAYPDIIEVDFTDMVVAGSGFELPDYHNKDAPNPYDQSIEDFGPSVARTEKDSSFLKRGLEKRDASVNSNPFTAMGSPAPITDSSPAAAAAVAPAPLVRPVGGTAEELTRSANPAVFNR